MHKTYARYMLWFLPVFCFSLFVCSAASAMVSAPGWEVIGRAIPTNLPPGGEGVVKLYVYDLGAAPAAPGAILTDTLPEGLTAIKGTFNAGADLEPPGGTNESVCEGSKVVTCELRKVLPGRVGELTIHVNVASGASGSVVDHVSVRGGGALSTTNASVPLTISSSLAGAGFSNLAVWMTNADGLIDTQAGSHPYDLTVAFGINDRKDKHVAGEILDEGEEYPTGGQARTINVNLPTGLVGNPQAVPQCTRQALDEEGAGESLCPYGSQIGENRANIGGFGLAANDPVYNMVPPPGVAAQFAFIQSGNVVFLDSGVRTGGDNGITTHVRDIPERDITFNTTTIWGVPGEASHDGERFHDGERCYESTVEEAECPVNVPSTPLLTLGTSCQGPEEFSSEELGTWEDEHLVLPPARYTTLDNEGNPVGLTGCQRLQPFNPLISISPDTSYADTPAGLSVDVKIQQGLNPEGLATPGLKNTTVVLPEGVVINPGQATGLEACQPSQESLGTLPDGEVNESPVSCPAASKVGTDEITTPVLRGKLVGERLHPGTEPAELAVVDHSVWFRREREACGDHSFERNDGTVDDDF